MTAMQDCIRNCLDCHAACVATAYHCLHRRGDHAEPEHIRLLLDCAQICMTSADFMLRHSPLHPMLCRISASICKSCADDCARLNDDAQMQACIDACRACAVSCAEMAGTERMAA